MLTWAWLVIRKSCWEAPGGQAADLLVPLGPVEAAALVWRFTLTASANKHLTPACPRRRRQAISGLRIPIGTMRA